MFTESQYFSWLLAHFAVHKSQDVCSGILAVQHQGELIINVGGLYRVLEPSEVYPFPINAYPREALAIAPNVCHAFETTHVPRVGSTVLAILQSGSQPDVASSIIEDVAIDVVCNFIRSQASANLARQDETT